MAERSEPSAFFRSYTERVREAARLGPVLDVACGRGRHALAAAALGAEVIALDRDRTALAELAREARERRLALHCVQSDLESPHGLPVAPGRCGAILVFRFLHRPLAKPIVECLRPGGLLLYETFTIHQKDLLYGPRNPSFLLSEGELGTLFPELEILESWEGWVPGAYPEAVARLAARRRKG